MRIFLDANILFSAAKSAGAMRAFIRQLGAMGHVLVADGYVVGEARRNLEVKYPEAIEDFDTLLVELEAAPGVSMVLPKKIAPELPEKDRPVLAAAIQLRCEVLVTGDQAHFGPLYGQCIEGVTIQSPANLGRALNV